MVSNLLQKQQVLLPFQFLLTKLSFVKITPLLTNHMKIFNLRGIFIRQISCVTLMLLWTMIKAESSVLGKQENVNHNIHSFLVVKYVLIRSTIWVSQCVIENSQTKIGK